MDKDNQREKEKKELNTRLYQFLLEAAHKNIFIDHVLKIDNNSLLSVLFKDGSTVTYQMLAASGPDSLAKMGMQLDLKSKKGKKDE